MALKYRDFRVIDLIEIATIAIGVEIKTNALLSRTVMSLIYVREKGIKIKNMNYNYDGVRSLDQDIYGLDSV
jgi:hypothetical protein